MDRRRRKPRAGDKTPRTLREELLSIEKSLPVTVLIAVKNEAANLAQCLAALRPASRVIVIDSASSDASAAIAEEAGAEVRQFQYSGGYPKKRQWALDTIPIDTEWVLLLDADEVVPDALWAEIAAAIADPVAPAAFLITKGFHFLGRRFRFGGFSHSAVLLFRRGRARFECLASDQTESQDMEVHERIIVDGGVGRLHTPLIHDDHKGLDAYVARHEQYATWEARVRLAYLEGGHEGDATIEPRLFGNTQERRRFLKHIAVRIPFEPAAWFLYHYIVRLGFLEGRGGLLASRIRAGYIANVRAKLAALRRSSRVAKGPPSVVLLNRFYWPDLTATAQMLTDLAEDLAAAGWHVAVVTSTGVYAGDVPRLAGTQEHNGVRIVRVKSTNFGRRTAVGRIADYLTYLLGSVWHLCRMPAHDSIVAMSDPPFVVAVALVVGRARGWRVVYWVQDLYPQLATRLGALRETGVLYRFLAAVARRINARCDLLIALGPRMRDALIDAGAPPERTIVLSNWADADAIRPIRRSASRFAVEHELTDKFVVLYSGNFGRAHTFDAVIEAMTVLRDDPAIRFIFVGAGIRLPELRTAVARRQLVNVRFFDYVPRALLGDSLSSASVSLVTESPDSVGMLLPSKLYGILASGRPVVFVGSAESDVAAVIEESKCGVVVPVDEPQTLVAAILELKASESCRTEMGRCARHAAESLYDRRVATARWAFQLDSIR